MSLNIFNACNLTATATNNTADYPYVGLTKIELTSTVSTGTPGPGFTVFNDSRCWGGKIYIPRVHSKTNPANTCIYVTNKAHTGTASLKVFDEGDMFYQTKIKLHHDPDPTQDKYVFSAWVSEDNMDVPSYDNADGFPYAEVYFYKSSGAFASAGPQWCYISSTMIEGWQKVEGTFAIPADADYVMINLGSIGTQEDGSPIVTYWDDIRLCPFRSNMKTFVYDKTKFKLLAVLDENNFATIYNYDEAGNLYLVKKETPEGIETIKESRQHLKE